MSRPVEQLQETFVLLAYASFLMSVFLVLSHMVNIRLTINAYTTLQSLSIIIFCIPFSFFLIDAKKTVCFDHITHSTGKSNVYCQTQGVLFVLGFHAVVLSLVVRVFSIYMTIVCSRSIPRVYPTIMTLGISIVFGSASSSFITYEGGVFCSPSPRTTKFLLQIPLIIYSCIGILLQLGTTIAVTKTLWIVRSNIIKSQQPADFKFKFSQKLKIILISYFKSVKLLWRTYILSMFLAAVMVFVTIQYVLLTRHGSRINDRLATIDWVSCILVKGNQQKCTKYLEGQGMYIRTLVTVILLLLFTILFLMTEYRVFLFRAWFQFLKHPSALFSQDRSDRILDTLDDSLSKVWLPEKLQNSFLGSFKGKRNESATQRALEAQLVLFTENQEKQRKLDEEDQLAHCENYQQGLSSIEVTSNTKNLRSNTKDSGKFHRCLTPVQQQELLIVRQQFEKPCSLMCKPRPTLSANNETPDNFPSGIKTLSSKSKKNLISKKNSDSNYKNYSITSEIVAEYESKCSPTSVRPSTTIIPTISEFPMHPKKAHIDDGQGRKKKRFMSGWKSMFCSPCSSSTPLEPIQERQNTQEEIIEWFNMQTKRHSTATCDPLTVPQEQESKNRHISTFLGIPTPPSVPLSPGGTVQLRSSWSAISGLWGNRHEDEVESRATENDEEMDFMEFLKKTAPPGR